ncbi:MAG TPA: Uma2 family endonuclease [Chitinophagales bacterium]|nr:Uma2 family endonuclease [Chitinophagales bacterium]
MDSILEPLVESPRLNNYLAELEIIALKERIKRMEFYNSLNEDSNAEFINGNIVMHSPVTRIHSIVSDSTFHLLSTFCKLNNLGEVHHEKVMISLTRNDYEPDLCFFSKLKAKEFDDEMLLFPAPNLIVEILSKSTEDVDWGVKFEDYASHGINEYWIIDPRKKILEQYFLDKEQYHLQFKGKSGTVKSRSIKNLQFTVKAIFDENENLKTIQRWMKK